MKILSIALLPGLLLALCPLSAAAQQDEGFVDVPKTHWAYDAVTDLKRRGILIGYPPSAASQTKKDRKAAPARRSQPHSRRGASPHRK